MLSSSTIVKGRWKIVGKIGQGAFGETYAGFDMQTSEDVAIKVERWDNKKMVLKMEVMALKKLQQCPFIVRYAHSGRQDDFNFLVMERLGDNLAELRKRSPLGTFYLSTTLRIGIQMIDAIEGVHNLGYIHRDIKPSNFVIGRTYPRIGRIFLIDFGLARKYRLPTGEIRPPRKTAGFRGTARYASINSHQLKELSRRDDLWSVFYVLVEFALGQLPWRRIKDKDQIGEMKEKCTNPDLVRGLPHEFLLFLEHLQGLGYSDQPDYDHLRRLLHQVFVREGFPEDVPFDWEMTEPPPHVATTSSVLDTSAIRENAMSQGGDEGPAQSALSHKNSEIEESPSHPRMPSEASGAAARRASIKASPSGSSLRHSSRSLAHVRPGRGSGEPQMYSTFVVGSPDEHHGLALGPRGSFEDPPRRKSSVNLGFSNAGSQASPSSPRLSKDRDHAGSTHLLTPLGPSQNLSRSQSSSSRVNQPPSPPEAHQAAIASEPPPTKDTKDADTSSKKKRQGCVRCAIM